MMRNYLLGLVLAMIFIVPASAQQSVVIDLNEKAEPFSQADYDELLACTLTGYPEETKRSVEYFLNRRDVQSPEQNASDPDSGLITKIVGACYEFQNGKPIPFSFDALIADWASHHEIVDNTGVQSIEEFAACAVKATPHQARQYIAIYRSPSVRASVKPGMLSALINMMSTAPCSLRGEEIEINLSALHKLFDEELKENEEAS